MSNGATPGQPISAEDLAERTELRDYFSAVKSVARVEAFARFVFMSTTAITGLAMTVGILGIDRLNGLGWYCYAAALAVLGISLAASCLTLAPYWVRTNRFALSAMRTAVERQFSFRRGLTTLAAWLFALALVLAGLAPAVSRRAATPSLPPGKPLVKYTITAEAGLDVSAKAAGLAAGTPLRTRLVAKVDEVPLAEARGFADAKGDVEVAMKVTTLEPERDLSICVGVGTDADCEPVFSVRTPRSAPRAPSPSPSAAPRAPKG